MLRIFLRQRRAKEGYCSGCIESFAHAYKCKIYDTIKDISNDNQGMLICSSGGDRILAAIRILPKALPMRRARVLA